MFDVANPLRRRHRHRQQQQQPKPKEKEGGSAPKNIKSEATPVVAPKPKIVTPPVQKIAASETPRRALRRRKARPTCAALAPARAVSGTGRAAAPAATDRAGAATMELPSRRTS